MVLKEVEVSQITNVLLYLCMYLALLCRSMLFESRSAFQVLFQVHKNKLPSYVSNMLWQMVSKEVQILLKCCVSSITVKIHCKVLFVWSWKQFNSYHYSDTMIKYVVRMMTNADNVESSLLILFIIRNLVYVQFLLQVAHIELWCF